MKRTALARGTKGLPARSTRRTQRDEREAAERTIERELVFSRDRHTCQVAVVGAATAYDVGRCYGRLTPHHRRKDGQGGAYTAANLVAACAHHNDQLEADAGLAAWAHGVGLVVRQGDPEWAALGR